jgi:acid stress-induced BolA-like protein IbaG/YrbA|tara:strand:+ start:16626 stop:16883 length:258 start_codon:yes stop_codon:yes gene_type:complete
MENQQIEALLKDSLGLNEVHVTGDGSHFQIIAISDQFAEMSRVKKQQFVYAPLASVIAEGSMHAVSIKTFTVSQWKREKLFNMPQ